MPQSKPISQTPVVPARQPMTQKEPAATESKAAGLDQGSTFEAKHAASKLELKPVPAQAAAASVPLDPRIVKLKNANHPSTFAKQEGYQTKDIANVYGLKAMISEGYSIQKLMQHFELKSLQEAGMPAERLRDAGVDLTRLIDAGYSPAQLRELKFEAGALKDRFTLKQLVDGKYTADQLRKAGYRFKDLQPHFDAKALKLAGYGLSDMCVSFPLQELVAAGFTLDDFQTSSYKFSLAELKEAGFPALAFLNEGSSLLELKQAGFTLRQLKEAGMTASQLIEVKFRLCDFVGSGFKREDYPKNITNDQLWNAGVMVDNKML